MIRQLFFLLLILAGVASASPSLPPGEREKMLPLQPRPAGTVVADVVAINTPIVYNRFGSMNPFGQIYALAGDIEPVPGGQWTIDGLRCRGEYRLKAGLRPRPLVLRGNVGDVLEVRFKNLLMTQPDLSRDCVGGGAYSKVGRTLGEPEEPRRDQGPLSGPADWPRTTHANLFIPGVKVLSSGNPNIDQVCQGLIGVSRGQSVTCRYQLEQAATHLFSSNAAPSGGQGDGGSLTHGLFGALHVERAGSLYFRSQVTAQRFSQAWPAKASGGREALDYRQLNLLSMVSTGRYKLIANELHAIILEPPPRRDELRIKDGDIRDQLAHTPKPASGKAEDHWRAAREVLIDRAWAYAKAQHAKAPAFREFTAIFHDELKTIYADPFTVLGSNPQLAGVKDGFGLNYGASGMGTILLANRLGIGPARKCVECLYEEFFLQSWANGDPALLEEYKSDPANVFHSYLNDRVAFRNLHAGPKETHVFHLHAHQWLSAGDEDRGSYLDSQTIAPMQGHKYEIYAGGLKIYGQGDHEHTKGSGNRNRTVGDSIFHCHLYPHFAQGMWALWRVHDVLEEGTRTLPDGQSHSGLSVRPSPGAPRPGTDPVTGGARAGTPIPGVIPIPRQALPPLPSYGARGMPGYPFFIPGTAGHRAPQPPLDLANDAGLPRHVVLDGVRVPHVSKEVATGTQKPSLKTALSQVSAMQGHAGHTPQQQVQRSLALADFTAELHSIKLNILPLAGTPLERRAMQFHAGQFARQPLPDKSYGVLRDAQTGAAMPVQREAAPVLTRLGFSGYPSTTPEGQKAEFSVNGAPPQAGAPYADPCGAPRRATDKQDAFSGYRADPALIGFRRYDVSAIQLNLVVNKDGWHDPQGRINVLSADLSPRDKANEDRLMRPVSSETHFMPVESKQRYFQLARVKRSAAEEQEFQSLAKEYFWHAGRREGRATTQAEPFFFRAQSGECITYYHSNRIPKDLERDDFQMRTPTDTIGQHIHLVKFDVTSSDGSGNGFNYEDGTLAPDAVLERKCAYNRWLKEQGQPAFFNDDSLKYCDQFPEFGTKEFAELPVQTTIQRWFADPIVTVGMVAGPVNVNMPGMSGMKMPTPQSVKADRTLRTVFTHDHFAPSSIQHHGFYSALLIEPPVKKGYTVQQAWLKADGTPLADPQGQAVGWQAVLRHLQKGDRQKGDWQSTMNDAWSRANARDYREFAIAIADFALLYEPKKVGPQLPNWSSLKTSQASLSGQHGLDRLLLEAQLAQVRPQWFQQLASENKVSSAAASLGLNDVEKLQRQVKEWRDLFGRPVDPPLRPEAISTAHHNPFLVNYRQEPIPLRVGVNTHEPEETRCGQSFIDEGKRIGSGPYFKVQRVRFSSQGSVRAQRPDERGNLARVFQTVYHGDPCTPVLKAYEGERVQFRLIQGAQEVQHVFTVEGLSWKRLPDYDLLGSPSDQEVARGQGTWPYGRPWKRSNPLGLVNAQEIGISEHFESEIPPLGDIDRNARALDRLYHFGSQDDLWNGAWGLIRTYNSVNAVDSANCKDTLERRNPPSVDPNHPKLPQGCDAIGQRLKPLNAPDGRVKLDENQLAQVYPANPQKYRVVNAYGADVVPQDWQMGKLRGICPVAEGTPFTRLRRYAAVATRVGLIRPGGLAYAPALNAKTSAITDPDALIILPVSERFLPKPDLTPGDHPGELLPSYTELMTYLKAQYQNRSLEPFVLRAPAGDCVELVVFNLLTTPEEKVSDQPDLLALPDARGDAPMPRIVPLNVDPFPSRADQRDQRACDPKADAECEGEVADLRPSAYLSLTVPQVALLNYIKAESSGPQPSRKLEAHNQLNVGGNGRGTNDEEDGLAAPPTTTGELSAHRLMFYAGELRLEPQPDQTFKLRARPYHYGVLPLRAYSDVLGHGVHGLFGAVVIEPQGSQVMRTTPGNPALVKPAPSSQWHSLGLNAFICTSTIAQCQKDVSQRQGYREYVLAYRDGLNFWWNGQPVGHCLICNDSYDFGDRGFNYTSAPFWYRLRSGAQAQATQPGTDLNRALFPQNFLLPSYAPVRVPRVEALSGQDVRLQVLQVDGRARQHAFVTGGYSYHDLLPQYNSPGSALIAPGRSLTAALQSGQSGYAGVQAGCSLLRDGPGMFFSGGMWGLLDVRSKLSPTVSLCR